MAYTFNPFINNFDRSLSLSVLDARYLKLDCSNDPLTDSLDIYKATTNCQLWITTYGNLDADYSRIYLQHSENDTALTMTETSNNSYLGLLQFNGVSTGSDFVYGSRIYSRQTGVAGAATVNAELWIHSYNIKNHLWDNAGVCKFSVLDSDSAEMTFIDSDGNIATLGGASIGTSMLASAASSRCYIVPDPTFDMGLAVDCVTSPKTSYSGEYSYAQGNVVSALALSHNFTSAVTTSEFSSAFNTVLVEKSTTSGGSLNVGIINYAAHFLCYCDGATFAGSTAASKNVDVYEFGALFIGGGSLESFTPPVFTVDGDVARVVGGMYGGAIPEDVINYDYLAGDWEISGGQFIADASGMTITAFDELYIDVYGIKAIATGTSKLGTIEYVYGGHFIAEDGEVASIGVYAEGDALAAMFNGDVYPSVNYSHDLGASTYAWSDFYIRGNILFTNKIGAGGNGNPAVGLHVGTAASSHTLISINDALISGKLEVNGISYFDSNIENAFTQTVNGDNYGYKQDVTLNYTTTGGDSYTGLWTDIFINSNVTDATAACYGTQTLIEHSGTNVIGGLYGNYISINPSETGTADYVIGNYADAYAYGEMTFYSINDMRGGVYSYAGMTTSNTICAGQWIALDCGAIGAGGTTSLSDVYGVYVDASFGESDGGELTATNYYGIRINDISVTGTPILTNQYGIYIEAPTAGSTLNYPLYIAGGSVYFGGGLDIAGTSLNSYDGEGYNNIDVSSDVIYDGSSNTGTDESLNNLREAVRWNSGSNSYIGAISFKVRRDVNPSSGHYFTAEIYADVAGTPSTTILQTAKSIRYTYNYFGSYTELVFEMNIDISTSTDYWLCIKHQAVQGTFVADSLNSGTNQHAYRSGGAWTLENNKTLWHKVYGCPYTAGILVTSDYGTALYGVSTLKYGGYFASTYSHAVFATSDEGDCFHAELGSGARATNYCFYGSSGAGTAAYLTCTTGYALNAQASLTGKAGYFYHTGTGDAVYIRNSSSGNNIFISGGTGSLLDASNAFTTTAVTNKQMEISCLTTGTAAAGFGGYWAINIENANNQDEERNRIEYALDTATDGSEVSHLSFYASCNPTVKEILRVYGASTAIGGIRLYNTTDANDFTNLYTDSDGNFHIIPSLQYVVIGDGSATDYGLFFYGETNQGYLTWMEDEALFALDHQLDVTGDVRPATDNTYYLGKNDDDSPQAWKGVILKDQTDGKYYRIELNSGVVTVVDLTD